MLSILVPEAKDVDVLDMAWRRRLMDWCGR